MITRRSLVPVTAMSSLAWLAVFPSCTAIADVKRHASIAESLHGSWAPNVDACSTTDRSVITLSAKSYVSSEANCTVDWVSETPGPQGPIYGAHLQCSGTAERGRKTISDVVLKPTGSNELSIGADFRSLKIYQRCPASTPAPARGQ